METVAFATVAIGAIAIAGIAHVLSRRLQRLEFRDGSESSDGSDK